MTASFRHRDRPYSKVALTVISVVSLLVSQSASQRETDQTGSETLADSWLACSRANGRGDLPRPVLIGQRPNTEVRFPYGTAD